MELGIQAGYPVVGIKATLLDDKSFKYSGIRGYGTLTKQEETE